MTRLSIFLLGIFVGIGSLHASPNLRKGEYIISAPTKTLKALGVTIEDLHHGRGTAVVNKALLQKLKHLKVPHDIHAIGDQPIPKEYLNLNEVKHELETLAKTYPKYAKFVDLNQMFKTPKTAEGRSIWAIQIHNPKGKRTSPAPSVLLDSIHHARELITPMVTVDAAKYLLNNYGKNAQVTRWVDNYQIWIIPVLNPDGYVHVFTKNMFWRKNRRNNFDGSIGVDINRNYPYLWGTCGKNSTVGSSEVYKGPAAASEPEVKTILALGKHLQPYIYLTYHSYGNEVIYPYVCRTAAESSLFQSVINDIAKETSYRRRIASSSGESFEHFYALYGSHSYLIEVGKVFHPPADQIVPLVTQARKTWQVMLERGLQASLHAKVIDAITKKPLRASVSLDEVKFLAGEVRFSNPKDGLLSWLLATGNYTLRVSAPGYRALKQSITISPQNQLVLTIQLYPLSTSTEGPSEANDKPEGWDNQESKGSEKSSLETHTENDAGPHPPQEVETQEPTLPDSAKASDASQKIVDVTSDDPKKPNDLSDRTSPLPEDGCGCQTSETYPSWLLLGLLLIFVIRRR